LAVGGRSVSLPLPAGVQQSSEASTAATDQAV